MALDGLAWRTPASLVVDDAPGIRIAGSRLGMEGVVAKRLDSKYTPGRRTAMWIKHKLRREEQFAVTGARRTRGGTLEGVFVARQRPDGSFAGGGSIELGPRGELAQALERQLAGLPNHRRGAVTWYPSAVSVVASCHGLPDGPVRDAVLHAVVVG